MKSCQHHEVLDKWKSEPPPGITLHTLEWSVKTSPDSKLWRGVDTREPSSTAAEDVNGKSHDGVQCRGSVNNVSENEMGRFPHTIYQKQLQIIKSVKCRH